jgi:L-alanine-DL-glutamate epimerase-like enolase superfamily enzyme
VVEGLFYAQNLQTALIMGEARGAALAALAEAGLEIVEIAPRKVKQAIVGYGAAQKEAVARMVQRLLALPELPAPDAADALVVKPMASGLEEAVAMMRRARDAGLPAIVTTTFDLAPGTAVAMHLAALVGSPGPACGLGTAAIVAAPLGHGLPGVHRGSLALPETPGLGVEFDDEAIERYAAGPWEEAAA